MRIVSAALLALALPVFPLAANSLAISPAPLTTAASLLATFTTDPIADCGPTGGNVSISGDTIRVALFRSEDAGGCTPNVLPRSVTVNLGFLAAGDYTLSADYKDNTWTERITVIDAATIRRGVWFDPPNPDSATRVVAHTRSPWTNCGATGGTAERTGRAIRISIEVDCSGQTIAASDAAVDLGVVPAGTYDVTVGSGGLLILIAEETLAVSDTSTSLQIAPNVSSFAGDPITLKAPGLVPQCYLLPNPTFCGPLGTVRFGDVEVPIGSGDVAGADTITVRAPGHTPGVVDVTVTTVLGQKTFVADAGFEFFNTNQRPDPAFFEPVLFPVLISGPGAFGALWQSEATLRNENDFYLSTGPTLFNDPCSLPCDVRPRPHSTLRSSLNAPDGFEVWVPRQAAPNLSLGLLVRDLSRQDEAFGTEIPIVREKDFFDRRFTILNVPADTRYRVALRLYQRSDVFPTSGLTIEIRELEGDFSPLVMTEVPLSLQQADSYRFGYIGDLLSAYPQLVGKGPLRVDVVGGSRSNPVWAFVSVTNNTTQHVTVISPQ